MIQLNSMEQQYTGLISTCQHVTSDMWHHIVCHLQRVLQHWDCCNLCTDLQGLVPNQTFPGVSFLDTGFWQRSGPCYVHGVLHNGSVRTHAHGVSISAYDNGESRLKMWGCVEYHQICASYFACMPHGLQQMYRSQDYKGDCFVLLCKVNDICCVTLFFPDLHRSWPSKNLLPWLAISWLRKGAMMWFAEPKFSHIWLPIWFNLKRIARWAVTMWRTMTKA